jgi:outer membrane biogenesis lipoprotein LolB
VSSNRRAVAGLIAALMLSGCAAKLPPRPVGASGPDPTAADSFAAATASCRGFRSIEGELALSGRAGEERVRGRVIAGLEAGGAVRLEAPAPFGAPFFILAGRNETATLILPRERRVLKDTPVSDVLERLTGLSLGADDLRLILSGCLVETPAPTDGRQWPGGWQAVTIGPERVAYLRTVQGRPVLVAADYGPWHVDYSQHANGFPRVVRVRRGGAVAKAEVIDITARVDQLEVNTQINPRAWVVDVPSDADPMTLDELRSIAPLAERK